MSTPSSRIASIASGLTCVASVPALKGSKRSPARYPSSPSAIWDRAELWVQRKSTRDLPPASGTLGLHVQLQVFGGLGEQVPGGVPAQRVEAPPAAPLLVHEPGPLELLHVVGDLRLARPEVRLELADADAGVLVRGRDAAVGQAAATPPPGHHPQHPDPDGIRERPPERDAPSHPRLVVDVPRRPAVLRDHAQALPPHRLPRLRLAGADEGAGSRHPPERVALLLRVQALYHPGLLHGRYLH